MNEISNLLDAHVNAEQLPQSGLELNVEASAKQLLRIAKTLNVSAVVYLCAKLWINPVSKGIELSGTLSAEIAQPCVVTLVPVVQKIEQSLARTFLFGEDATLSTKSGSEVYFDLQDDDLPDYFTGPDLDLSRYLIEVLGLAIDLYPRAPGAEMSDRQKGDEPGDLSPFSILKSIDTGK